MATVDWPNSTQTPHGGNARPGGWAREIQLLLLAAAVYFGVRVVVEGSAAEATTNAERLMRVERWLEIDVEQSIQQVALDSSLVRSIGDLSYVWLHWPLLIAVLAVLFHRDYGLYRRLRNAMFASGAVGLVLFTLVPMSPPRFMPGFVGTVSDDARRHYLTYPLSWTNRFAAFPSFHVGWTLIACLALAAMLHSRPLRVLAVVPAVLVGIAVITTGNHYVIDSLVGGAIALGAYRWFAPPRPIDLTTPEHEVGLDA